MTDRTDDQNGQLWDMSLGEADESNPIDPLDLATVPDTVYIPTDGRKKMHADRECSNMSDPRKVSIRNAAEMGFDACKRCGVQYEMTLH